MGRCEDPGGRKDKTKPWSRREEEEPGVVGVWRKEGSKGHRRQKPP